MTLLCSFQTDKQTNKQTDGRTDGCYQVQLSPCFAVDNDRLWKAGLLLKK